MALASYVSVQSRPFRYPWCRELSSSALANFPISGPEPDHTKGERAPWRRSGPHGRMRTIPGGNDI